MPRYYVALPLCSLMITLPAWAQQETAKVTTTPAVVKVESQVTMAEEAQEAIEAARDVLAEGDLQGLDRREWVYEVADESGATVLVLRFEDALEPDLPPDLSEVEDNEIPPMPSSAPKG